MSIEVTPNGSQERYPSVQEIFQRARIRKLSRKSIDTASIPESLETPEYLTTSTILVHAQTMERDGLLTTEEAKDTTSFWKRLEDCYEFHHVEQVTPVTKEWIATIEAKWTASGLTTIDETTKKLGAIPIDTLRASIISGNIKALFKPYDEYMVHSVAKFLENLTGVATILGDFDPTDLNNEILSLTRRHDTLQAMVNESAERNYTGKYYGGPRKHLFADILSQINTKLIYIDPTLTIDALHAKNYQSEQTQLIVSSLNESSQKDIDNIAKWRYQACIDIAKNTWSEDQYQTIPLGLFNRPRATKSGDYRACTQAVFRMVHQGITGLFVGEHEIRHMMQRKHGHQFVSDEEYLKLLETDTFRQEYGKRVQSLQFMGMDLNTLRTIAERKHAQHDDIHIYTVANLATASVKGDESDLAPRIQHRVLLYGADEQYAYVLDPNHRSMERMDKRQFCKRWAATQNSGYLVVAK